jgi:hypothetical protein
VLHYLTVASFEVILRRLTHLLIIAVWLGACVLAGIFWLPGGVIMLGLGVLLLIRAIRKGKFDIPASAEGGPPTGLDERQAKMLVTQVLRNLTRVQVAYLSQKFDTRSESRAWLKHALPRAFHQNLDELHATLENARLGNTGSPGLRLTMQILGMRDRLQSLEDALAKAREENPDCAVAHPTIFVVTEHLGADKETEPEVLILAGWDPSRPTLLPHVDAVTFYSEVDGSKKVRGMAVFEPALRALGSRLRVLGGKLVYKAEPVEDPAREGVALEKVPLGFVVGTAEFL